MTTTSSKFFDELAKLMSNAAGAAQGVRKEFDTLFRTQMERAMAGMNVVQREEFEAVREMAAKAREENERLQQRVAELEAKLAITTPPSL
jgi:BMFP domain-containing protein YqiC